MDPLISEMRNHVNEFYRQVLVIQMGHRYFAVGVVKVFNSEMLPRLDSKYVHAVFPALEFQKRREVLQPGVMIYVVDEAFQKVFSVRERQLNHRFEKRPENSQFRAGVHCKACRGR